MLRSAPTGRRPGARVTASTGVGVSVGVGVDDERTFRLRDRILAGVASGDEIALLPRD